jgi:chemotaxis signal transduction protein
MGGVLLFMAGGTRFGVAVGDMLQLLQEGPITPVPFGHPALVGLMRAGSGPDTAPVPIFDLRGLGDTAPEKTVPGATIAVVPTARGPVGLRLDQLLTTVDSYTPLTGTALEQFNAALPPELGSAVAGAASTRTGEPFFLFNAEAFVAALGLATS